jgi:hypothetical protein
MVISLLSACASGPGSRADTAGQSSTASPQRVSRVTTTVLIEPGDLLGKFGQEGSGDFNFMCWPGQSGITWNIWQWHWS